MMQQTTFQRINTSMAWLMFAIAAIVYGLTIEPTASLWDCPEFIACGYKLEIGHPPGAPVFMLVANLFSQLASDNAHVAMMVNLLSALLSAGCIFFLFLTVTHLAKKLISAADNTLSTQNVITIEACGVVGALAYTFSDTFWFSAVEAEVYAFSSFLTALMFWLILKWEDQQEDRWIILIAYITGLSIGVHLLCLLCLPAMSFVVYFRKTNHITTIGILKTLSVGALLVGVILYGIIPGIVKMGGLAELLFSNLLGCPYNTGVVIYIILLVGALVIAYYKVKRRILKLSLACVLMILAGYSSYGVILIRANANPPMCENAPDNCSKLGRYLSREQYGDTPLYPRIYSGRHVKAYEDWMGEIKCQNGMPTKAENLRFFISYQVNFMYWRYFLWNFVGRQNNIQGHGEVEHGNWITGIAWIDDWLLGCDTAKLPSDLAQNKGRNVFYALPLLLGLAGIIWQWRKNTEGRQQLWIVALLFVMTGLAIVVYLNQTPLQPRERDYAYAGSFYAFAIWIGLGAAYLKKFAPLALLVPLQMASQTWDDHDRSGRYVCRDFGANYLESMQREGHPIILTDGDNDTFPLWYNQEVEGVRTDTRDCNMEYLQTDWYIDQMKRPAYDSPALPISLQHEDYQEGGKLEYLPISTDSLTIGSGKEKMVISLKGKQVLYKNELMVLDMLSQADWRRPVYLSISMGSDMLSFLRDYLVLEGLAYRVSPTAKGQQVDVERLYDNVMHRFRYGGLSTKGIYVDEDVKRMAYTHQIVMGILIDSLLQQHDTKRALAVCRKWQREMPSENVPYSDAALSMARCYYLTNHHKQGDEIVSSLLRRSEEWLSWIETINPKRRSGSLLSQYTWMQTMKQALSLALQFERTNNYIQYFKQYEHHIKQSQKE